MVQINWTHLAIEDLMNIYDYIAHDSRRYAKIQIIKLKSRTQILKSNPLSGKLVPELDNHHIRELIEGNYRIIYKILDDTRIDILTVHHSARGMSKRKM
jgi:addiction module RelE/StbE family toxin